MFNTCITKNKYLIVYHTHRCEERTAYSPRPLDEDEINALVDASIVRMTDDAVILHNGVKIPVEIYRRERPLDPPLCEDDCGVMLDGCYL